MERRTFVEKCLSFLTVGGILLLVGCERQEKPKGFGNQERLWKLVTGQEKSEEPVELRQAKNGPAFYRDASMGKAMAGPIKVEGG